MCKAIDVEYAARPLNILSTFQRDSLPGMVCVEARSTKQVQQSCNGLVGIYLSRGIYVVPIEEMVSLMLFTKKEVILSAPGICW
jgi:transcription elongation factor SPT5